VDELTQLGMTQQVSGQLGTPEQIAALVSYLVSKEAQYVTGK
jgi:NAD(P)-dependent dehydrogenase (short-subunit alcohol dehydrogenase family)